MNQKELIVKIVSAVAWADGSFSDKEKKKLAETCENLGELDQKEIDKLIESGKNIDSFLPEVKDLEPVILAEVLNFCYRMAASDNGINAQETAMLRKICLQIWPEHKTNLALRWMKNVYEAEEAYTELFILPHYKKSGGE